MVLYVGLKAAPVQPFRRRLSAGRALPFRLRCGIRQKGRRRARNLYPASVDCLHPDFDAGIPIARKEWRITPAELEPILRTISGINGVVGGACPGEDRAKTIFVPLECWIADPRWI